MYSKSIVLLSLIVQVLGHRIVNEYADFKGWGADQHKHCCFWAGNRECDTNPSYMRTKCQKSCGTFGCRASDYENCVVSLNIADCPFNGSLSVKFKSKSSCERERKEAIEFLQSGQIQDGFIPTCTDDGRFRVFQCHFAACFCVNPATGKANNAIPILSPDIPWDQAFDICTDHK